MVVLSPERLVTQKAIDAILTDSDGAYVLFVGVVRDHSKGRSVTGLEYQVHAPMAIAQLEKLVAEVQTRWDLKAAVLHRYGYIPIGEEAVVVCVASSHRGEAFEACRWLIDTLKLNVPIWKKEFCPDGTFWIEGTEAVPAES
jgi:molybdopterin synthase catalytic subunit